MAKFYAYNVETSVEVIFNEITSIEEFYDFITENEEKTDYNFMPDFAFYADINGETFILEADAFFPV